MEKLEPLNLSFYRGAKAAEIFSERDFSLDRTAGEDTLSLSIRPSGNTSLRISIPLGKTETVLVSRLSLPAAWLMRAGTGPREREFAFLGPALSPVLRLRFSSHVSLRLERGPRDGKARFEASALPDGQPLEVSAASAPGPVEAGILPAFDRNLPNEEAARALLCVFARIDHLDPALLGEPTHDHRKILSGLREAHEWFHNFGTPKELSFLAPPEGEGPAGIEATWAERRLLVVEGRSPERSFPGPCPAWLLMGSGEVPVNFSQDCKGFTALTYDFYGRPRTFWGGEKRETVVFRLSAGDRIVLERA